MVDIDEYLPEPQPPREPPPERAWWPWAVLALLLIAGGIVGYLLLSDGEPPPPPPPAAAPPAEPEAPSAPAAAPVELPALAESDDWLRRAVGELSTHPDLVRWLVSDELVRRFTAAVDNVARGESPRPHLGFLDPGAGFSVVERDGRVYTDARSHERYARVAEVVGSIDAAGAARLYRDLEPLLQEGYAELGYPDRGFDDALAAAIRHLAATPLPEGPLRLSPGVESYGFRDPELEALSAAQKHLLRMGPDNAAVVIDKLRQIARLLDLPAA